MCAKDDSKLRIIVSEKEGFISVSDKGILIPLLGLISSFSVLCFHSGIEDRSVFHQLGNVIGLSIPLSFKSWI